MPDVNLWLLVFLRISALLAIFPVFSARNLPRSVRVGLGALTAFLIAPGLAPVSFAHQTFLGLAGIMAMEIGIGLLLGFVSRMVFFTVDFAARLISTEIGLNIAPDPDPFNDSSTQAPGLVLSYLTIVLMFSLDLHHWLLVAFQHSYEVVPIGGAHLSEALLADVLKQTSRVFLIGVQMAAPVIAVSFIITLIMAVLGRVVPQMNVFTESFSIRILGGLVVFGLTFNLMAQELVNALRQFPFDFMRVAQLLGAGG